MSGWSESIADRHPAGPGPGGRLTIGVLPGEGIGPEVVDAAVAVLEAVAKARGQTLDLRQGPQAGREPDRGALSEATTEFCRDTFAAGGAILAGAHGGRWVYELRQRFDLFCKLSPLRPPPELGEIDAPISPRDLAGVDIMVVREQTAGIYQGRWGETDASRDGHVAEHSFSYTHREVHRVVEAAAALARRRRGRLAVIVKRGGIPSISRLWEMCAAEAAERAAIEHEALDVDFAVYRLMRDPSSLDVIVAPNLFGDVLADAGAALLGSRGVSYGGNFDAGSAAVYQTNHGGAFDLAGTDRANPVGQILAAAMMLTESFALAEDAELIASAVGATWRDGWRTEDLAEPGCTVIGTAEMGRRVAETAVELAGERSARASTPSSR